MSDVLTAPIEAVETVQEVTTSNDKPESAHVVLVPEVEPDQTPQAYVLRARIEGFAIVALCGFTWMPNKKAEGLPVCKECLAIYRNDPLGHGDRGELPDE